MAALWFTVLGLLCCISLNHAAILPESGPNNKTITLKDSTVIIIIFDGFSWEYLRKLNKARQASNLTKFYRDGFLAAEGIMPQMVTSTFPNHYSIITGLYTESHGIINNIMTDPRPEYCNETFNMKSTDPKWWEYRHAEPLWLTNQNNGKKSGVLFWPGHNVEIRGSFPSYRIKESSYNLFPYVTNATLENMPWTERVDKIIEWLSLDEPPNFLAVYFEEPDEVAHEFGPNSNEVLQQILRVDDTIGYMRKKFQENGIWDQVNIIVTADHGMVEYKDDCNIFLDKFISNSTYELLSWQTLLVQPHVGFEEEVFQGLKKAVDKGLLASVYKKEDIPETFHYKNNIRIPDIIAIPKEGCRVFKSVEEEHLKHANLSKGGHGYSPQFKSMRPFFAARGPAFRKGYQSHVPFENIHIYSLICKILQINPSQFINGSLDAVEFLLKERPSFFHQLSKLSPVLMATVIISVLVLVIVISFGIFTCISQRVINHSRYVHRISMKDLQKSEEPLLKDDHSADEMEDPLED